MNTEQVLYHIIGFCMGGIVVGLFEAGPAVIEVAAYLGLLLAGLGLVRALKE